MPRITRREFLHTSALAGVGTALAGSSVLGAPEVITSTRTTRSTGKGELIFTPHLVQSGRGPHLLDWAYATDTAWDTFVSAITCTKDGVSITDAGGREKFGINVRWNAEGFGYIFLTADNGGEFYELPPAGSVRSLNLNYELAHSRIVRNRSRRAMHERDGWSPPRDVRADMDAAEGYLADAKKCMQDGAKCGGLAQKALVHALWAGEKIELDYAEFRINRAGFRKEFFIGCDARGYYQMDVELFLSRFTELFEYATITHYLLSGVYEDFEPQEGNTQYDLRDALLRQLKKRNITVEGRPLFWSYKTVTPDWLRNKSYDQVRIYVEKHVREVVKHYGDSLYAWEVVNEFHDWANECRLTQDQIVEVTRLACEVARDTNPGVRRLINNCAPFAEYVQLKKMTDLDAVGPQRTPYQFLKQLADAGVPFDIAGIQMYFPYRDLADTAILLDKFRTIGKPMQLTEVGASSGPSEESLASGKLKFPAEPYVWHRPWDEELQADWMEGMYSLAYANPAIEAANWYDFVDPFSWIPNGGLLRSPKGEKRAAVDRLLAMKKRWKALPSRP